MERLSRKISPADWGSELPLPEGSKTGLYPLGVISPTESHRKIPVSLWPELAERSGDESLRDLAYVYGVSHEAVRRTLRSAKRRSMTFSCRGP